MNQDRHKEPVIIITAIYVGNEYPELNKNTEYKISLTHQAEYTFCGSVYGVEKPLQISGLWDLLANFTQICVIKKTPWEGFIKPN